MTAYISESRTEDAVACQLLTVRGWDTSRPPKGNLLRKQEYRQYPHLMEALAHRSKTGTEEGYPDFLLVERESIDPLLVLETKADEKELRKAVNEAEHYAEGFFERGQYPLSVGVAGTEETEIAVGVCKWARRNWKEIKYRNEPIQWIPTPEESRRLLLDDHLFVLDPEVPSPEVLAKCADQINRILRECRIKDEFRPAVLAAFMLGLWKAQGKVNTHPEYVLPNVNAACKKAFESTGKFEIASSLHLPEENEKLSQRAAQICYVLRLLNVTTLTSAHDYLGQLYETFFQFTGGNTIGQYFTPRHVAKFMTDLCDVSRQDAVLDPTCGTGGFLIASLYRMIGNTNPTQNELTRLVEKHLLGFESEPITAALCVANMILRGDGATGIYKADCFTTDQYPLNKMSVVLGNPPFPHKATDDPPDKFVDRALEALSVRGRLALIVPSSFLSKKAYSNWRSRVLKKNTLKAVIKLPDELFQPFASSYGDILVMEKGVPHRSDSRVFFCYIRDDGYKIKKRVRTYRGEGQLPKAMQAYRSRKNVAGLCSFAPLVHVSQGGPWGPGSYVTQEELSPEELLEETSSLIRNQVAFQVQFADKVAQLREAIEEGRIAVVPYQQLACSRSPIQSDIPNSLGSLFDIYYGQKELHSKENLAEGDALVISSKGTDNGCYGFFNLDTVIEAPFVASPGTGSIGEASVQLFPCGISDDCLLLFPRKGTQVEELWVAAATIRRERWRFHYGFKLTPDRIKDFVIPRSPGFIASIRKLLASLLPATRRLSAFLSAASGGGTPSDTFNSLVKEWKAGCGHTSKTRDLAMHPAYQRIIGMGEMAVPLLLAEMGERPDHWTWALRAITGVDPVPEQARGRLDQMAAAWIKWGKENGYLQ